MNTLLESYLYAAVCNRGSHMQIYSRFLDTKNGYHGDSGLQFDDSRGSSVRADVDRVNNGIATVLRPSEQRATFGDTQASG